MRYQLRLGEAERFGEPEHKDGDPVRYRVLGAPAVLSLEIVKSLDHWRIGRVVDGVFRWYGNYETPAAALHALQEELDGESRIIDGDESTDIP